MEDQQGTRKKSKYHVERNWAEISNDVLFVIFHKLGVVEVLLSVQAVCRSWRQVALDPACQVWRCIDTWYLRRQKDIFLRFPQLNEVKFNQLAIDRSGCQLEKLYLCSRYSGEFLTYITGRTPRLRCFTLISSKPHREELANFLAGCPLLEELHICTPSSPTERYKFEDLQLDTQYQFFLGTESYSDVDYTLFMENIFGITRTLTASNLGYDTDSEMSDSECRFSHCDKVVMDIATNLPQLRVVQLIRLRITNKGLHAILDKCRKLEFLDVRRCFEVIVDEALEAKLAKIKNVKVSPQSLPSFDRREALARVGLYNVD